MTRAASSEPDREKAIADLRKARESHVSWRQWWEHEEACTTPGCTCHDEKPNHDDNNVEYETYWIEAYDNILRCLGVEPEVQNGVTQQIRRELMNEGTAVYG